MSTDSDVVDILAETGHIPRDRLRADVALTDVGLDSLALLEVALAIQKDLGVAVDDAEVAQVGTVAELVDLVQRTRGTRPA
jgi:acyl carrier protein